MDPIDVRVDMAFAQALRCVEFRLPGQDGFRASGYLLSVGARYGLVGIASFHHLLITASEEEEGGIMSHAATWQGMVEDHLQWEVAGRLAIPINREASRHAGRIAALSLRGYYPLYRKLWPLVSVLDRVGEAIISENREMITEGWPWLKRKHAMNLFRLSLADSIAFALHFFERREASLDEVPEIALIGE